MIDYKSRLQRLTAFLHKNVGRQKETMTDEWNSPAVRQLVNDSINMANKLRVLQAWRNGIVANRTPIIEADVTVNAGKKKRSK